MNRSRPRPVAGLAVVPACAPLAGCTSSGRGSGSSAPSSPPVPLLSGTSAPQLQSEYVSTINKVLPSVVLIRTQRDLGSGIVFDSSGDIVTNYHVVGSATKFQVVLSGSTQPLAATLVGPIRRTISL